MEDRRIATSLSSEPSECGESKWRRKGKIRPWGKYTVEPLVKDTHSEYSGTSDKGHSEHIKDTSV